MLMLAMLIVSTLTMTPPRGDSRGMPPQLIDVPRGLNGVAVTTTTIGDVLGNEGYYHYRGQPAPDLARRRSFSEVANLVLGFALPVARVLPKGVVLDRGLRTAVSSLGERLGCRPVLDLSVAEREADVGRICATFPTLVASLSRGRACEPRADLGPVENFLYMLLGAEPTREIARALEQYLILTIDHGFNASTFTARVIASTGADVGACVTGALGALTGPLHGGAPGRVLDMLDEIGDANQAEAWMTRELDADRRLMGFGHAVYRAEDPRGELLREVASGLGGRRVELAIEVERVGLRELATRHAGRRLVTNVEFYGAVVMEACGIPRDLMTATFASSRVIGWGAHILEQAAEAKLIRPSARYVGP